MASTLATIGMRLLMSLVTEEFIKRLLYRGAEEIAKKTQTTIDDDVVKYVGEAWGLRYPS